MNPSIDKQLSYTAGLRRSARIANKRLSTTDSEKPSSLTIEKPIQRMCTTCFVQRTMTAFPEHTCSTQCKHKVNTCRTCTRRWITLQLDVAGFMRVRCPECKESMGREYMRLHGSEADDRRAQAMEKRAKAEATPGWRWCLNPACDAGQVCGDLDRSGVNNDAPYSTALSCDECGAQACIACDRPVHEGKTCSDARAVHAEAEAASDQAILWFATPCPTCSRPIEKDGGCNEVLCTQCGTNFCWLCGSSDAEIEARGGEHAEGCSMNDAMGAMDALG